MQLSAEKILSKDANDPAGIDLDVKNAENYIKNNMDRDSGTFASGQPDTIVVHYTGSTSDKGAINALYSSKREVSAHFVIENSGKIVQLMPLDKIAWHAGISKLGNRTSLNKYSIGIEIVNPGYLTPSSDGNFISAFNEDIPSNMAVKAKHRNESNERYWCKYNIDQIEAVNHLCLELKEIFGGIRFIVGHDEISPKRKQDPGPLFPIEKLRDLVLQQGKQDDEIEMPDVARAGHVNVDFLNIREKGESSSRKVALPLNKGQKVEILDENNGWYKVKTEIDGWVSAKYVD